MSWVIGFVGYSGSGKTTLATQVVRALVEKGYRVSAIKNAHHQVDLDRPGKDTHRYRSAGANEVILSTQERWVLMQELDTRATLKELLARLSPVDIVVVEGFKGEDGFPQIEVFREGVSDRAMLYPASPSIVALATDQKTEQMTHPNILNLNDLDEIVSFIEKLYSESLKKTKKG